jgi:hypothetical protein
MNYCEIKANFVIKIEKNLSTTGVKYYEMEIFWYMWLMNIFVALQIFSEGILIEKLR